ncbi:3-ketoacyl-CoA thiolase 1, peroxisomal-like isoform X1 [Cucumis melo var. makuwa]|uniref:3-ketoacyl-CoA thiolase 1, peroxisomal-like isoform X1 n=1 Tax=Cucumis melo var. makuwa TaxID=1194695 RepID=A0A5D3DEK0_CUCMM|nr:3-ketoacyl-CoA thiolase 1, peroxisomal-like isoform X1 [Cucumis melo var. makuwa]
MLQGNRLLKREVGLKCTFLRMSVIGTFSAVGMDPTIMVVGLAVAILAAIKAVGHESNDIYLFEVKEIKIVRGNNWTGSCVNFDEFLRNPGNGGGFLKLYESNDRPNLPKPT